MIARFAVVLSVLLAVMASCVSGSFPGYVPTYKPVYCNQRPEDNTIVPLTEAELSQVDTIKQVQTMIRHGSRTPWGKEPCWKDYTIPWSDCNVTELMLASPVNYPYDGAGSQDVPEPWLFRKEYNAFTNLLGGTNCYTGQLLKFGYDQEQANGRIFNKAYLNQTDSKLNIFSTDEWANIDAAQTFFRSDDEQRTLMSGQTMLSTFFDLTPDTDNTIDSIVTWHTGDDALDQIAPNPTACPLLNGIQSDNYASSAFQTYNNSAEIVGLTNALNGILGDEKEGYWTWYSIIDCFMTAVCNDYPIPANPVTGAVVDDAMFNATIENVEFTYEFNMINEQSKFAKLAMGHTIYEMRTRLQAAIDNEDDAIKYGLWSAHDTSIMPLLAALLQDPVNGDLNGWDGKWAKYASFVTIELYTAADGGADLFRMTYNGQPVMLPACSAFLCPASTLMAAMDYAQDQMPCDYTPPTDDDATATPDSTTATIDGMDGTDWTLLCILCTCMGMGFGAIIMRTYQKSIGPKDDLIDDDSMNNSEPNSLHQILHPSGGTKVTKESRDVKNPMSASRV